jgi:glycosyltransferase involved in cell wall biosynthesis
VTLPTRAGWSSRPSTRLSVNHESVARQPATGGRDGADDGEGQTHLPPLSDALEATTGPPAVSRNEPELTSLRADRAALPARRSPTLQAAAPAAADMRIALVHDWFPRYRGGERVVESMLGLFPEADVFTLFDFLTQAERDDHFGGKKFTVSALNSWPLARRSYRHLFFLCPFFIEQFNVTEHDGVISSSAAFARGVITRPDQPHLCYVHSPIRYAWDQQFEYLDQAGLRLGPKGLLFRWMLHRIRIWDVRTAFGPDLMAANSTYVRERMRRIYGRDALVIYPPFEVDNMPFCEHKDDYYVVASFLVPYKRIDLIVRAFNAMPNRRLLVVGEGQQARELKAMAGPNITFTGYLSRTAFLDTIAQAKAFIFAACEDFGIVMAEAQVCGTPLIAFGRGGARDIVRTSEDGVAPTGLLFGRQTTEAVIAAVEAFEAGNGEIAPEACRENAMRFSEARFHREFNDAWGRAVEVNERGFKAG